MKALDAAHLLIILTAQESRSLGLDADNISWDSLRCRLTIARLFAAACIDTKFSISEDKIAIRAMTTVDGECVLIFSAAPAAQEKRKIYKIKTSCGPFVYEFSSSGDVLNAIERLFKEKIDCSECKLVRCKEVYRLIVSPKCSLSSITNSILKEYGRLRGKGDTAAAFALEDGELLCNSAISTIGGYLS